MAGSIVSCCAFPQFLVDQQPHYDKYIIEAIRPIDMPFDVTTGTFESASGTLHYRDRFDHVEPNSTKAWEPVNVQGCVGSPCDMTEHLIGWGATRLYYGLMKQSWATPLLCYDQDMHITHARDHFQYIIRRILKPATVKIINMFLKKGALYWADNKWVANGDMDAFTYTWVAVNGEEIYLDCDAIPTSLLTPQMLQRRVEPLMDVGYMGEHPYSDRRPPVLDLITDTQTLWSLDHLQATGGSPSVAANWRFEQFSAGNAYWKYGYSGQLGNFGIKVDTRQLRFNYVGVVNGKYRFQIVLPYKNIASSGAGGQAGLRSIVNTDFHKAQYALSFVWHARGIQCLVSDAKPLNKEMPFATREFGGQWQFVMDNLGADVNGVVIENKRRNKGQFIADFKMAIAPDHTEFLDAIFHMRDQACVTVAKPCNASPGYPEQDYNSANQICDPADPTAVISFQTPAYGATTSPSST